MSTNQNNTPENEVNEKLSDKLRNQFIAKGEVKKLTEQMTADRKKLGTDYIKGDDALAQFQIVKDSILDEGTKEAKILQGIKLQLIAEGVDQAKAQEEIEQIKNSRNTEKLKAKDQGLSLPTSTDSGNFPTSAPTVTSNTHSHGASTNSGRG